MKILIIQTAFIGDVVLATSLVEAIAKAHPSAQIDLLVRQGNQSLLANNPHIHEVLVWNKKENKLKNLAQMRKRIKANQYDKVVNLQRFGSTGYLTAFSGAKEKIGYKKNGFSFLFTKSFPHEWGTGKHEVERNFSLISDFVPGKVAQPKLYPSVDDFNKVKPYQNNPYITISPTSVWFTKQYPAHKWIEFIQALPTGIHIYLLGGPGDKAACDNILQKSANQNIHNLAGQLSFLQSAALMKAAVMNYMNDSGPLHFASAVNANTAAVFCSTVPRFGFGPLADNYTIIETTENLECRPCGMHGHKACPLKHFKCAENIDKSQLLAPFNRIFGN